MIFLDASPEPFHVVQTCIKRLTDKGFVELNEKDLWRRNKMVRRGGKYFFTRNGSTFCAFVVGEKYESGSGFKIIGAHTDSPNLKLKPKVCPLTVRCNTIMCLFTISVSVHMHHVIEQEVRQRPCTAGCRVLWWRFMAHLVRQRTQCGRQGHHQGLGRRIVSTQAT